MENPPKETARDTFLHLLAAAMVYLSVIGFITLWWQIINFLVPDKLNPQGFGSQIYMTLIWGASALLVAFPVHVLISWIIGKDLRANPAKRDSQVRKWLWYITLFISAITIIIDLVSLIFNFLRGDLTIQFFLKSAVILAVTAAVFGYYLWDLRRKEITSGKPKTIAIIAALAIAASVIYGFTLFGSPANQRNLRFDEQRISQLQQIQDATVNYWQQKRKLPASINDLNVLGYTMPVDPETGNQYEYAATGDVSFKLCAEFKTSISSDEARVRSQYSYMMTGVTANPQYWAHPAGRACFDITIDPDFFKEQTPANPESMKNMLVP